MHRYHLDPGGHNWSTQPEEEPPQWTPTPRPGPYGPVPSPGAPPASPKRPARRTTPDVRSRPKRPAPPPRRKRVSGKAVRRFLFFLALILLLTGAGIHLRLRQGESLMDLPRNSWDDMWDVLPQWQESSWQWELMDTDLRRAATGDGTVLELKPIQGESLSPQEIYRLVNPAVVRVRAARHDGVALGTGVIMSSDGYILTNAHVIAGSYQVDVVLTTEKRWEALLVGYDSSTDLAVLKVEARGLPSASFGDSVDLQVGDPAYAIGNPLGEELRGTMTEGIVSAIDRTVSTEGGEMTLIQTSAALNPGNSGGALINAYGQVVGITNMKMMAQGETIESLGFAIPTASIKPVVDQIIAQGYYGGPPLLGLTVQVYPPSAALISGGVSVTAVIPSDVPYSAWDQGIRPGDVIVSANGSPVTSPEELEQVKAPLTVGDSMDLTLWNDGETRQVRVVLMSRSKLTGQQD